jgi:rubrerythrin
LIGRAIRCGPIGLRPVADRKLTEQLKGAVTAIRDNLGATSGMRQDTGRQAGCRRSRRKPEINMNRILFAAAAVAVACLSTSAIAAPPESKQLSAQTRANLEAAMHGEAYANLKYLRYADQAEAAGKPWLAKLFRESANVEANEHFDREAQALKLGGADGANLDDAMAGEHYENVTMYIDFAKQAEADGDLKVSAMFRQIAVDEGTHYEAYKAALAKLSAQ